MPGRRRRHSAGLARRPGRRSCRGSHFGPGGPGQLQVWDARLLIRPRGIGACAAGASMATAGTGPGTAREMSSELLERARAAWW
jgi:hypothetical protein